MKTFKNIWIAGLIGSAMILSISSCQKDFNPKSYDPPKPPPTFNGYSSSAEVATSNLVAYWSFNGTLKDSISGVAGVSTGTSFTTGITGQALKGAENAYVISAAPPAVKALHSFTITVWYNNPINNNGLINPVDIVNNNYFWGNMDMFIENPPPGGATGNLKVHLYDKGTSSAATDLWAGDYTITKPYDAWHQLGVTYDDNAGTAVVYFDGNAVGTQTQSGFSPLDWSGVTQMVFGTVQFETNPSLTSATGSQPWANYLTGSMEHVRVYNTVLNSKQAFALYSLEKLGR
jgi:hypothetical protein